MNCGGLETGVTSPQQLPGSRLCLEGDSRNTDDSNCTGYGIELAVTLILLSLYRVVALVLIS